MTDLRWVEFSGRKKGREAPKWARSLAIGEDGTVFIPAVAAGNEMRAFLCASWDGVACIISDEHPYLPAEWMARKFPEARDVVAHLNDVVDRLFEAEPKRWRVLRFPAIAEESDILGRKPGDALWPAYAHMEALERIRGGMSSQAWAVLYQQRPTLQEGAILRRDWWRPWIDEPPRSADVVLTNYSQM